MDIKELLNFDMPVPEFELLETEKGAPGFFGKFRDAKPHHKEAEDETIPSELKKIEERIKYDFRTDINIDIIIRNFMIGEQIAAMVVFINGMTDNKSVNDFVLRDGMKREALKGYDENMCGIVEFCDKNVFTFCDTQTENKWSRLKKAILDGKSAVLFEGEALALVMDTRGYEKRGVSSPQNEKVVRGPHEGFTENLRTNITLLRRLIRTEDFVCEFRDSGGDNSLTLVIAYREGVANTTLIEEIKRRLAHIDTRMVISTGIIEQFTERRSLSVFPQILSTERPDRVASYIMQGHVAVLLDGSPLANVMPTTLFSLMSSAEDAYLRRPQGTVIRTVRFIGAGISIIVPAFILALSTFHQGLLSTEMLSTLITSRIMVFAPMGMEMVFLLLVFQLIREAGLRVAGGINQAVGIIGGLILGQAAVSANLVSSVVLIIVAITGLGNFCIPDYSTQIGAVYLRLALVIAAWIGGLLGVTCVLVLIFADMARLKSFGVPFLSPFAPKTTSKHPMILRGKVTMHQKATDYTNTQEE